MRLPRLLLDAKNRRWSQNEAARLWGGYVPGRWGNGGCIVLGDFG